MCRYARSKAHPRTLQPHCWYKHSNRRRPDWHRVTGRAERGPIHIFREAGGHGFRARSCFCLENLLRRQGFMDSECRALSLWNISRRGRGSWISEAHSDGLPWSTQRSFLRGTHIARHFGCHARKPIPEAGSCHQHALGW